MVTQRSVSVDFDVPATMRDGTVLRANVYRPAGEGRWPVLLTRLPYGKDFPLGTAVLDPVQAARRGYVVVVQDTRGTNASDGDWYPFLPETEDGIDTVAWAAGLPSSNGQVGMFGASYFGHTQWRAALGAPPALQAMVPFITWSDPLNGLCYRGGAFELGVLASWNLRVGLNVLVRRHRHDPASLRRAIATWARELDALGATGYSSLPLAELAPLRQQDIAPAFFDAVAAPMDPSRDPASHASLDGKIGAVRVPALNIGGWYDIFLAGTIANFQVLQAAGTPARLLIGPWSHGSWNNPVGEVNFGFGAQTGFIDLQAVASRAGEAVRVRDRSLGYQ